ncbi:cation-translocating P-type ATPase [Thalassoroseus pseudoceratinae]|uniref:cation-translocating P-type ATPase n=1 Tax=Thalassoroseus pseudoceratinae TaxID=2713176 RepID=UPI00141E67C5|nr:cation-translocating P-type ATPase [Thalassoroseus pseudoceratinae]
MSHWYQQSPDEVARKLSSDLENGLSTEQVESLQAKHGPNELIEAAGRGPWKIVWEQISGPMVILLIIAAAVSVLLHEYQDAIVILLIVVLNAVLGFIQDYRAEQAMAALKQMTVPHVRVRRSGRVQEISALELVPGDLVLLEAGNVVPADGRLIEAQSLRAQEAALTGESEPVEKSDSAISEDDLAIGDRRNLGFMGTQITYGRGSLMITETGMNTELGNIADMLQTVEAEETPLQRRLGELGKGLAIAAIGIVAVVVVLGLLDQQDWKTMLLTGMAMAVAAVPEGLPAVATVALALGARKMLRRHALIRKLPAVETLGSVTVICSDKTGTLTENRMTVTAIEAAGDRITIDNRDVNLTGRVETNPEISLILGVATLCNDASLHTEKSEADDDEPQSVGDPTETALVFAATQAGLDKNALEERLPRQGEIPFESDRKRMATVHAVDASDTDSEETSAFVKELRSAMSGDSQHVIFVKGAVDSLLDVSSRVWNNGEIETLDESWRSRIDGANADLASNGMRVLGMAFRPLKSDESADSPSADWESDLIFVGLTAIVDPARPEVRDAVHRCKTAGIRPVMITGDHPLTARHIAKELGISDNDRVVTGSEMAKMPENELDAVVQDVSVFARVAPEHKLRIVQSLQKQGEVVAMTGDGVNDAPALKRAEIGVAMGITGTDVSKEASEMVLTDDNFATIVGAVEEGRIVYDNIRKFIMYTMTSNSGEIWVMLIPAILAVIGWGVVGDIPLPLLPLQILWINLVTDGLPGLALAVEPAERETMNRPPYPPNENFFGRGMASHILWVGLLMGAVSLGTGIVYWLADGPPDPSDGAANRHWRTIVFTVLTFSQMGHVLAVRSHKESLFQQGLFSNKLMLAAVSLTFALQLGVIYVPFLQNVFRTTALNLQDLLICLAISTLVFWAVEVQKWWIRKNSPVPQ